MANYNDYVVRKRRRKIIRTSILLILMILIVAGAGALAYVTGRLLTGKPLFDDMLINYEYSTATQQLSEEQQDDTALQSNEQTPQVTALKSVWNTMEPVAQTLSYTSVATDDRMLALPQNGKVDLEYFRTAMFVGDSLSQGFTIYEPLASIVIPAAFKGASPSGMVANNSGSLNDSVTVPMWDHIASQTPQNIYLGMGINALLSASDDEAFLKYYADLLDALRTQFPTVPIYVQSITPVTAATSDARPQLNNDRIDLLNDAIALMAMERGMYYLNVHEVLADENGALREDLAGSDGIHLLDGNKYMVWVEYLQTHTAYSEYNSQFLTEPYNF